MAPRIVTAALLVIEGRVLVARRPDRDSLAGLWEFPGGKLEEGESEKTCLARELREELELDAEIGAFFMESSYCYSKGEILLRAYWAVPKSKEVRLHFHTEVRWVTPSLITNLVMAPADIPIVEAWVRWCDRSARKCD